MLCWRDARQVVMCDGCYKIWELDAAPSFRSGGDPLPDGVHLCGASCEARWVKNRAKRKPEPHLEAEDA